MIEKSRIQSHHDPRRFLKQHVAEIIAATNAILEQHGQLAWRTLGGEHLAIDLARLHDLGKASRSFQEYIADPKHWSGDARRKAHTLLSLVLATSWAKGAQCNDKEMIERALAVKGHHGGLPFDDASLRGPLTETEWRDALCAEIPTIDMGALVAETDLAPAIVVQDPVVVIRQVNRILMQALDAWRVLPSDEMRRARFIARAGYSVLLEADKAFLAVERSEVRSYLHRDRRNLPAARVASMLNSLDQTPMDALRERARSASLASFAKHREEGILTLTLPTGAGKTLLAAQWALDERARLAGANETPTIVIALPMLSIVDQTEKVWRELLDVDADDGDTLLPFHSLSDRAYDCELDAGTADFFIDTWRSEVVITTFDQILLALYSDRAKHAMRYHRLLNALIIIDEVQCVPPALWAAMSEALDALNKLGRTRILAMSATPSPCLSGATEVLDDPDSLYAGLTRYELHLEHETAIDFNTFMTNTVRFCHEALSRNEGMLVTVNLRATAQETLEGLIAAGFDPLLLSGDMTPFHRLSVIETLKHDPSHIVVSTQCVEAGVDLDMHRVIRDFAPLDALVQIAGRCNRHARRTTPGTVTVAQVRNPFQKGKLDAECIYDPILLQCTRDTLHGKGLVPEADVLSLCRDYYARVAARKVTGRHLLDKWARIEAPLDVRGLLRGDETKRQQVFVTEQDPTLKPALLTALDIRDHWERRRALRALAPRMARHVVTVSQRVFDSLATQTIGRIGVWHELLPGQYHRVRGIDSRVTR